MMADESCCWMKVDEEFKDSKDCSSSEELGDVRDSLLVYRSGDDDGGVVEKSLSIHLSKVYQDRVFTGALGS